MAKRNSLSWRELKAGDGSCDGYETVQRDPRDRTRPKYAISSIVHVASGTVEWFLERSPMHVVEDQPVMLPAVIVDEDDQVLYGDDGMALTTDDLHPVYDDDGNQMFEQVVVADNLPPGSIDAAEVKALAQAYEDGPKAFAEFEGARQVARDARRGARQEERRQAALTALGLSVEDVEAIKQLVAGRG